MCGGKKDSVNVDFEDGEFEGHHVASIHNIAKIHCLLLQAEILKS